MLPRTVGVDVRVIVGRIAVSASQCQCHDGLAAMVVGPGGRASGKRMCEALQHMCGLPGTMG